MKECYEILETLGQDGEIEEVKIALHFYDDHTHAATTCSKKLMATIPADSENDVIIHSILNAIGSGSLKRVKKETKEKFPKETNLEYYYSKRYSVIERVYVKLALIELNLWDQFKEYFESDERSNKELLFFHEAKYWNKYNQAIKDAFQSIGEDKLNEVYRRALQLSIEENIKDIFE